MTGSELLKKLQDLVDEGNGDEQVYLDTNPMDLFMAGDIGMDSDGVGIIIWKETFTEEAEANGQ